MTEDILRDKVYTRVSLPRSFLFFFLSFLMLALLIRTAGVPMKNVCKFISVNHILHLDYFQKQSNEYVFFLAFSYKVTYF